ncbi:phosphonate transport system permease protein [Phyllobacterium sp. 1468]|uniref:phosphonate ABC transporter, permease protein PhnE n=1 Tax=Phyllobacterium sp. 1468 TaxID=2817759 RepID=UPI002854E6E5|nr:phosphonate ABC transporter, permease protein PhnE [Phyllobacterium sp. 1468]MDR6632824.1 phosphonate transport system permease protein [Phyllobacterium sp. 1468]
MTFIDASQAESIQVRYPEVFQRSFFKRFAPLLMVIGLFLYGIYAVWFFEIPKAISEGHWERVGIYLSQWVSYDVQAEFRLEGDTITPKYPRFSPLGNHPNPDWVKQNNDRTVTVEIRGPNRAVTFSDTEATLTAHGESVRVELAGERPIVSGNIPSWISIYDEDVVADMGFAGEVRVEADRIKIRKRFLGWANFIFDPQSPFFGKSVGEVIRLVTSGPQIEPGRSNLSLAVDNFLNNGEWQHGDVWVKLLQTIIMAFLGTILGAVVSFPLAFLAARNITSSRFVNQSFKRFFDFLRSVDMLIWALFFTRAFGPGPLAGSAAIFLTETGTLGKIYSEGLENIDDKPREGVQSTGASHVLIQRYGVMPQVVPVMISQTLYQWESNIRGATIIGAVGAGGIGLKLWEAMRTNKNWENVAYMVLLILLVVFIFDGISNALRSRLIGKPQH